ncbi:hypothetical protein BTR23_00890 [Alkalihalophilus pseudofirmus]|uniref:hypothetical protein n=1 Tax=Alkalihalobacterium alkalinitrilicum TaxID=427920 RepID=UPI00094D8824|nr:hypothetical protein [Alkalihalobacterium alkalinitrilicum]OLO42601.1 hypothetical protein BTR23_00890 [Alkalihalophilus pseudofirmus]
MNSGLTRNLVLFIIGNACILFSARIFPSPKSLTFSEWLGELIFSPFSLLGAVLFFIVGFLTFAFLVKATILHVIYPYRKKKMIYPSDSLLAIVIVVAFIIQIVLHPLTGVLTVIFATAYGIMEANEGEIYDSES